MTLGIYFVLFWCAAFLISLFLSRITDARYEVTTFSAEEFVSAVQNKGVSDKKIKKMAPYVRRRSIEEVRCINDAIIAYRMHLFGFMQTQDHNRIY